MNVEKINEQLESLLNEGKQKTQKKGMYESKFSLKQLMEECWDDEEFTKAVIENIDSVSEKELIDYFNTFGENYCMYPSGFDYENLGAYPAKLAKALAKSEKAENFTEIHNIFYAGHNLSEGAIKAFQDGTFKNWEQTSELFTYLWNEPEDYADMLQKVAEHYPDFVNKVVKKLKAENHEVLSDEFYEAAPEFKDI